MSDKYIASLQQGLATGINYKITVRLPTPVACINGKQARQRFNKQGKQKTNDVLELLHTDVCLIEHTN